MYSVQPLRVSGTRGFQSIDFLSDLRSCGLDVPALNMPCERCSATFCSATSCSGRGVCNATSDRCDCIDGYTGRVCQISAGCGGPSDSTGKCCGVGGVLNRAGRCCSGYEIRVLNIDSAACGTQLVSCAKCLKSLGITSTDCLLIAWLTAVFDCVDFLCRLQDAANPVAEWHLLFER